MKNFFGGSGNKLVCKACQLKFNTEQELLNHRANFCPSLLNPIEAPLSTMQNNSNQQPLPQSNNRERKHTVYQINPAIPLDLQLKQVLEKREREIKVLSRLQSRLRKQSETHPDDSLTIRDLRVAIEISRDNVQQFLEAETALRLQGATLAAVIPTTSHSNRVDKKQDILSQTAPTASPQAAKKSEQPHLSDNINNHTDFHDPAIGGMFKEIQMIKQDYLASGGINPGVIGQLVALTKEVEQLDLLARNSQTKTLQQPGGSSSSSSSSTQQPDESTQRALTDMKRQLSEYEQEIRKLNRKLNARVLGADLGIGTGTGSGGGGGGGGGFGGIGEEEEDPEMVKMRQEHRKRLLLMQQEKEMLAMQRDLQELQAERAAMGKLPNYLAIPSVGGFQQSPQPASSSQRPAPSFSKQHLANADANDRSASADFDVYIDFLTLISKRELKSATFEVLFGLFNESDGENGDELISPMYRCVATRHIFTNDCLECYFFDNDGRQHFEFRAVPCRAGMKLVFEVRLIPDQSAIIKQPPQKHLQTSPLDLPRSGDQLDRSICVKPRAYCWSLFTPLSTDGDRVEPGNWRMNLFPPPLFSQIAVDDLKKLDIMPHSFLYIRILSLADSMATRKRLQETPIQLTYNMRERYHKKELGLLDYFSKSPQELMEVEAAAAAAMTMPLVKPADIQSVQFSNISIPSLASFQVRSGADRRIRVVVERLTHFNMPISLLRSELIDDISVRPLPDQLVNFSVKIGQLAEQPELAVPLLTRSTKCYILLQLVGGDSNVLAWARFYLYRKSFAGDKAEINEGLHEAFLFRPPVTASSMERFNRDATIWFRISDLEPSDAATAINMDASSVPVDAFIDKQNDFNIDEDTFDESPTFHICLDGARFIPHQLLCTRLVAELCDNQYNTLLTVPKITTEVNLDVDPQFPVYSGRQELEKQAVTNRSLVLFIKVFGLERTTFSPVYVGFSALNVFVDPYGNDGDKAFGGKARLFNYGAFQLPIYMGKMDVTSQLTMQNIDMKMKRLPCASLLIRLLAKQPQEFPVYSQGVYDSSRMRPDKNESAIYRQMLTERKRLTSRELISFTPTILADLKLQTPPEDLSTWISQRLSGKDLDQQQPLPIEQMDYTHLCRYDVNHGIALAIDGAQNLPSSKRPCLIICTLPETSERAIKFTRKLLVHSSVRSPCFKDGYWEFHPQLIRERLSVVVLDCRLVLVGSESINQQRACESLGWTFIPIFKRGDYANHGLFQLPIYAGDSSKALEFIQNDKLEFIDGASVFVRICDARRQRELEFDVDLVDKTYLPLKSIKRYLDPVVSQPISELIPSGMSAKQYHDSLISALQSALR